MNSSKFNPVDDLPLTERDPNDAAGVNAVIDTLASQINQSLKAKKTLRVALFGGLGQGKSSALLQALKKIETKRFYFFDVSLYKSDELEYEFDRIVGRFGIIADMFIPLLVSILTIAEILNLLINHILPAFEINIPPKTRPELYLVVSQSLLAFLLVFFTFILKEVRTIIPLSKASFLGPTIREFERDFNLRTSFKSFKYLFIHPKIIIVDNLDRASIDQQRAMFRALYKHSHSLKAVYIICMDESELLKAKKDPEDPSELLRKVVNFELRLPPRLPADAVLLSQKILRLAENVNDNNVIKKLLNDPVFNSDFATILSLLPNFSPRTAKHLLNDALLDAEKLNLLNNSENCSALLRLHILYYVFPLLRQFPKDLIALLENKKDTQFEEKIKKISRHLDGDYAKSQLKDLIIRSQGIQPLAGNWHPLLKPTIDTQDSQNLEEYSNRTIETLSNTEIILKYNQDRNIYADIWEALFDISEGYGNEEINKLRETIKIDISTAREVYFYYQIWLMTHVRLNQTKNINKRLRLVRFYRHSLFSLETPHLNENEKYLYQRLKYAFIRYCLSDHPAYKEMQQQEQQSLIDEINKLKDLNSVYLFALLPATHLSLGDALEKICIADNGNDGTRHKIIRDWLTETELKNKNVVNLTDGSLFQSIWPPLPPITQNNTDWIQKCEQQFKMLKDFVDNKGNNFNPITLRNWLWEDDNVNRIINSNQHERFFYLLKIFLYKEDKWTVKTWNLISAEQSIELIITLIDSVNISNSKNWFAALLLVSQLDYSNQCNQNKIESCINKLLNSAISLNAPSLLEIMLDYQEKNSIKQFWKMATDSQILILLDAFLTPPKKISTHGEEWQDCLEMGREKISELISDDNILAELGALSNFLDGV